MFINSSNILEKRIEILLLDAPLDLISNDRIHFIYSKFNYLGVHIRSFNR